MEKKKNVSGSIQATSDIHNGIVAEDEFQRVANKVSFVTIIGNILLSVMKLIAGFIAHSNAMISDAIHSASDVFSTFVVIIGIKLASKKADKELKKANREYEKLLSELLAEQRNFLENYMDIVDHAHFQEQQRAYYQGIVDAVQILAGLGIVKESVKVKELLNTIMK